MIKFDVHNRFTGAVQFTAEIDCTERASRSVKLGLAVKWAIETGANLVGADLARANLARANLARANLAGANLAGANLVGANLVGADLVGASLADADLVGASLADAYLARANLADAYLADANLARANLAGANLAGANWTNGAAITRAPLQLFGLDYPVTIVDAHMQIGCELHSLAEWEAFDDERISRMDGKRARRFWDAHRDTLLALARADGRSFE